MTNAIEDLRTPRFRHADEMVGVFGNAPIAVRQRVRQAIPQGRLAARSLFATLVLSDNAPTGRVHLSNDGLQGCVIEGHCCWPSAESSPSAAWTQATEHESGSFNVFFWDGRHHRVKIRTDRLGYRTLYYWIDPGEAFVVVASALFLMRTTVGALRPDAGAFFEQLILSSTIGDSTLLTGVRRLRRGVELTMDRGGTRPVVVDTWHPWGRRDCVASVDSSATKIVSVAKEVLSEWTGNRPSRIALSGGFDSRLLLCLALQSGTPITAVTLGAPSWIDRSRADEVTQRLRVSRRFVSPPLTPTLGEYLRALLVTEHVSDYMSGFWLLRYARAVATTPRPIVNGFLGGPVSGAATGWVDGSVRTRQDLVRGWLRHVNQANVPLSTLQSVQARSEIDLSPEALCARLDAFCPRGAPLFRASTGLEMQVRQFGFVSVGTYALYRRFARPLVPLADFRLVRLFGGLPRRHLLCQRAYRRAVGLVDLSGVPVASTSGRHPATFAMGPRGTVDRGFALIQRGAQALIAKHSEVVSELFDVGRLLGHLDDAQRHHRQVPQSVMLMNAALLWLAYAHEETAVGMP
jgi:hypothetical protein